MKTELECQIFGIDPVRHMPTIVAILNAIPEDWACLDGRLMAPSRLIANGQALETAGYELSRFRSIELVPNDHQRSFTPQVFEMFVEGKLPGFVRFDEVGYDGSLTLKMGIRAAIAYLKLGYLGWLACYSAFQWDEKGKWREKIEIQLDEWSALDMKKSSDLWWRPMPRLPLSLRLNPAIMDQRIH